MGTIQVKRLGPNKYKELNPISDTDLKIYPSSTEADINKYNAWAEADKKLKIFDIIDCSLCSNPNYCSEICRSTEKIFLAEIQPNNRLKLINCRSPK
jgi:hypothetical protein